MTTRRYDGKVYQIDRRDIRSGMRKASVRVEERLDGTIAVQFQGRYVRVRRCAPPLPGLPASKTSESKPARSSGKPKRKSGWMNNFSVRSGPSLRQAIEVSNARG